MRAVTSGLALAVVPVMLLLGACSGDDGTGGTGGSGGDVGAASGTADRFAPTGDPVDLTPAEDAAGDRVELADDLSVVVPEGSAAEIVESRVEGAERVLYRMPDADADGVPALQVSWEAEATARAFESTWSQETSMTGDDAVSGYTRSAIDWPGADGAVVATWTEEVATDGEPVVLDAMSLTVDTPSGGAAVAVAFAPTGELDGSTSVDALRTLAVG